jgi:hypothetical protein
MQDAPETQTVACTARPTGFEAEDHKHVLLHLFARGPNLVDIAR